jgi:hypothetical protein
MGYALMWVEGLAVALLCVALAAAWSARGRMIRGMWAVLVYLLFFAAAGALAVAMFMMDIWREGPIRTSWFAYALSWFGGFAAVGAFLLWQGLRQSKPGLARPAALWPRGKLWLGLLGAVLAFGFTFWNMDLAARAELAIARQEAGAVMLAMTAPPVADADNAARVYAEVLPELGGPLKNPWPDAALRGMDARESVDWKNPYVAEVVKNHEHALALLRKAAAMPKCSFGRARTFLDDVSGPEPAERRLAIEGGTLLAADARVQAIHGNLPRALEDVSAILGVVRHVSAEYGLTWAREAMAWRALEDVLRLAPAGKGPLPPLKVPELPSLLRKTRQEQALLAMVLPTVASQPSLILDKEWKNEPLRALMIEMLMPPSRVFAVPDELATMRRVFEYYRQSPRTAAEETPKDWTELRRGVESDPMSFYGVLYIKPKCLVLAAEASTLAALRQTARTGLAVAKYRRQHGQYPERLEQLVPDFLPAMPVDPRDGQPLRIKRVAEGMIVYAPQDAAAAQAGKRNDMPGYRMAPPIFRVYGAGE